MTTESRRLFPMLTLDHDIDWLGILCGAPGHDLMVMTSRTVDGELLGFAPFHTYPSSLRFSLGEIAIASKRVQRYVLEQGPLVRFDASRALVDACFVALRHHLPSNAVVFLQGVEEDSDLGAILNDPKSGLRSAFNVVPFGPRYSRCRIRWNGRFDDYLATLSKITRKDLRRTLRKAESAENGRFNLSRYTSVDDAANFIAKALPISEKTYQARLLGLGLREDEGLSARLRAAAERGYFLGHILHIDDVPVAFHYGYVFRSCFYMVDGGYDPDYAKLQIGMMIFLNVLQDIEAHGDRIDILDYLYGDGSYKERTSNLKTPERHYYLIPKTLRGAILAKSMVATDRFSRGLGNFLEKHGLKERIKRLIRRSA